MAAIGEFRQWAKSPMTSACTELSHVTTLTAVRFLASLILFAGMGCGVSEDSSSPREGGAPAAETALRNVILITMDTTRADALGAYGQVLPATLCALHKSSPHHPAHFLRMPPFSRESTPTGTAFARTRDTCWPETT
jgi:hypothetical protein